MAADAAVLRRAGGSRDLRLASLCIALLAMLGAQNLAAQEEPDSGKFSVTVAPGLSIGSSPDALGASSFSVGVGLEYGPLFSLYGAGFKLSLESGYSQQMGKYDLYLDASDFALRPYSSIIRRVPVMLWCTVESPTRISPFIRAGVGISWTQFEEHYSDTSATTLDATDWGFTWGIGGGIRMQLDQRWSVALFLDDWVSVDDVAGEVTSDRGDYSRKIPGPLKMTMVGVRGAIIIF